MYQAKKKMGSFSKITANNRQKQDNGKNPLFSTKIKHKAEKITDKSLMISAGFEKNKWQEVEQNNQID